MRRSLGTILPTADSIRQSEEFARQQEAMKDDVAKRQFPGVTPRIVGLEKRYYVLPDRYAIVGSSGRVLWFEVRSDGDYRINQK